MKKYLSNEEVKKELVDLLKITNDFLNENNIRYTIIAGTLLGAVRHGGFIPWDDDIDIAMTRMEYEKFIAVLKQRNCHINNNVCAEGFELGNDEIPFVKVVNKDITVIEKREMEDGTAPITDNLWLDVFCMDKVPAHFTKLRYKFFKSFISHAWAYKRAKKNHFKYYFNNKLHHELVKRIYKNYSLEELTTKLIDYWKRFDKNDSKYFSNNLAGIGLKEAFPKECMDEYVLYDFENIKVYGIKQFDKWLTIRYGDYMQLPPEEKRTNHGIIAWRNLHNEE